MRHFQQYSHNPPPPPRRSRRHREIISDLVDRADFLRLGILREIVMKIFI